ncbi:MAG: copper-translocating P-type ATPase, partial [Clostridia bacterium]|nr:copper-translocating P-type ATPase [Clostridia bacterium]
MKQYNITGMSCAACSARVEKAVSTLDGVSECSVNLLTNSMTVSGEATDEEIISAVKAAGYGASKKGSEKENEALRDTETPRLIRRLISSVILLAFLMYLSMGYTMWGFPLPEKLTEIPLAIALLQMALAVAVMIINRKFFINGFSSLAKGAPNMDTLVALGSTAAFVYSMSVVVRMWLDTAHAEHLLHELYFESAAMILSLITVGKMLESRAKGKTTDALKGLMRLAPKTANVIRDGKEITLPIGEVLVNDVFVVRPGENIPLDGILISGGGAVDESALTGESMPVDKGEGDKVFAATANRSGFLQCRATHVGEDTTFSAIIKMVSDASSSKAPAQKLADKVSGIFVPTVMGIALVTFIVWMALDKTVGFALARAISVLVISCPCALGLSTPVAIMVASGVGAKNGILFKTATSLEETGKAKTVLLDKTGTITKGEPKVTDICVADGVPEQELIKYAVTLECKSEHPLAKAIAEYALEKEITPLDCENFKAISGEGVSADVRGDRLYGGSVSAALKVCSISEEMINSAKAFANEGKTPLCFAKNDCLLGIIAVADTIKEDSESAIAQLKKLGIHTVMLTGDNERTAMAIAGKVAVDEVRASVMPGEKADVVAEFKKKGRVIMIGDGINDAPALTAADIGVAIGAGTSVAIDAASVVLVRSSLADAVSAIKLSR